MRREFLQNEQPVKDMQAACSEMLNEILPDELRYRRLYLQLLRFGRTADFIAIHVL